RELLQAIRKGYVASAHDVAEGGMGVAVAESLFESNSLGATVTLKGDPTTALFSESQSRFIVSVKQEHEALFEELVKDAIKIGQVTNNNKLIVKNKSGEMLLQADKKELEDAWKGAIPCLLN